ncbi:glycosyltransferase 87 family protein [Salinifilum ghardaiensis]
MATSGTNPGTARTPARRSSSAGPARDWRPLLIVAIVLEIFAVWLVHWIDTRGYVDTQVYQLGGRAWLSGFDLYGDLTPESPDSSTLPFIYPPFAALLFAPLSLVPTSAAVLVVSLTSHLSILVTAYALARRSPYFAARAPFVAAGAAALMPWLTLIEPARETLNYGQINLLLMALVAADCLLGRTRWPRGLLVGLAGAIKLTPLGFLLFFLLRRDHRALGTALATFSGTVLLGVLAAPRDSATWWLEQMFDTGGSMGAVYAGNLSLRSLIAKQDISGAGLNLLWIAGAIALVGIAVWAMRYAQQQANTALMLAFNAVLVVLISPISWSHHWVWAGPTLALLLTMAVRHRWYGILAAVLLAGATVLYGPQWHLPYTENRELDWTPLQQVIGNAYTLWGIALLIGGAVAYWRWTAPAEDAAGTRGSPAAGNGSAAARSR